MNLTKLTHLVVLAALVTAVGTGCRKRPGYVTPIPAGRMAGPTSAGPSGPVSDAPGIKEGNGTFRDSIEGSPLSDPGNFAGWPEDAMKLKAETVLFAFDSSAIQQSEASKVAAVADYMKSNPSHALRIEGHADERGTDEYNRALGERRALAVREELIAAGVPASRIVTLSYGEDRPADPGHNDPAWAKNRRTDFIVLTPPGA